MDDEAGVGTVSGRLEKEDKKMKTVDMELILLCALMAAIGAFGLVTGVVLLFGIQFQECNAALLTGIVCGLWGILWGSLLIQNRNLVSKTSKYSTACRKMAIFRLTRVIESPIMRLNYWAHDFMDLCGTQGGIR